MVNNNIYENLLVQFYKIFRHCRQGSIRTRQRYKEAFKRFLVFLAAEYRLERLGNISGKHVTAYVAMLEEKGRSAAYLKTELAGIRFFHDQIPNARYTLPLNEDLGIARRKFGGVDRAWSDREFNLFVAKAIELSREDYAAVFCLARYAGLRLHECFRMDTQIAAKAIKTGTITTKGKNGLVRDVPSHPAIENELKKMLTVTPRGNKLFVAPEDKTHLAMQRFEEFIRYYKPQIQDKDSTRPMTFHGLRHFFALEAYQRFIAEGCDDLEARRRVSKLLGHRRVEITRVYLASLGEGGDEDGC